jgi:decaprenyl-phosphate phosphoribosyltransferase
VLGILHYALRLEQGAGAAPEDLVLRDRTLQVIGLAWLVLFAIGVTDAA